MVKKNASSTLSSEMNQEGNQQEIFEVPEKGFMSSGCEKNKLFEAVYPHISSFNTFINFFVPEMIKDLTPVYIDPAYDKNIHDLNPFYTPNEYLKVYIRKVIIGKPTRYGAETTPLFPRECRNGHSTYSAPLSVEFVHHHTQLKQVLCITKPCGRIPIMVGSCRCHLEGLKGEDMVKHGEEMNETGGYFIVNGNERLIRFVIQQRCNYPIALRKARFSDRDVFFTDCAILMRCSRTDGTSTTNILFYTEDRQCAFRVLINRQEVVVNFWTLLRALMPSLHTSLVKKKLFEAARQGTSLYEDANTTVADVLQVNQLWSDFMDQEAIFCDLDKYENRYLHQLGRQYWHLVAWRLRPGAQYEDAGLYVINKYILVHCDSWNAKFEILILMYQKLMQLVRGIIAAENLDSFAYQEVMTPGNLLASVLKDALNTALLKIKLSYTNELRLSKAAETDCTDVVRSRKTMEQIVTRVSKEICYTLNYFMATGNIKTHQLDLQQLSGWTVVADRLNMNRFLSHFRSVHRGQFFAQMRTTEVRKLLGETWGFLCPVHTPDGAPCGLLLHLAQGALPITSAPDGLAKAALLSYLHRRHIATQLTGDYVLPTSFSVSTFPLVFDGQVLCRLPTNQFDYWVDHLRALKQSQQFGIPWNLEVAPLTKKQRCFEGIFIFSFPGRLIRTVRHLASGQIESIGPLGQPWMNIACSVTEIQQAEMCFKEQHVKLKSLCGGTEEEEGNQQNESFLTFKDLVNASKTQDILASLSPEKHKDMGEKETSRCISFQEIAPVHYTHIEISPTMILSITSSLTPFSHHNQSPRNMYQCQMLKQTMGTPFHSIPCRTDNKAYRLLFPQYPLVRTKEYDAYQFNEYPTGTNAVVAVISYTGFDMEDAMILNKASMERGAFHAAVYKTKVIDAAPPSARGLEAKQYLLTNVTADGKTSLVPELDPDGLPPVGKKLTRHAPFYRTATIEAAATESTWRPSGHVSTYHDDEVCYVDKVNLISVCDTVKQTKTESKGIQRASVRLRCSRNPVVGDKFASRAGQKGILSALWAQEDMPFTASGIVPDIVFNPHGFPSRMTIGELSTTLVDHPYGPHQESTPVIDSLCCFAWLGMLIESMAGKTAAIRGEYQDATSFATFTKRKATSRRHTEGDHEGVAKGEAHAPHDQESMTQESVDYFGEALLEAGYQYYGSEPLYSGLYGTEMSCHIFIGIIYYQRLRHMVSDKFQVRSTGPIDVLTRQPVKGRKRGGGVRFGEMERDAALAHGASSFLRDRLMNCSDAHDAFVCPQCGSILAPCLKVCGGPAIGGKKSVAECRVCRIPCCLVSVPFVFRYICNELAMMNVTIKLQLSQQDQAIHTPKVASKHLHHDATQHTKETQPSHPMSSATSC